jgi:hypothetical protein
LYFLGAGLPILTLSMFCTIDTQSYLFGHDGGYEDKIGGVSGDESEDEDDWQTNEFKDLPRPYWESVRQDDETPLQVQEQARKKMSKEDRKRKKRLKAEKQREKAEKADAKEEKRIRQLFIDKFGPKKMSLLGMRREGVKEVLEKHDLIE